MAYLLILIILIWIAIFAINQAFKSNKKQVYKKIITDLEKQASHDPINFFAPYFQAYPRELPTVDFLAFIMLDMVSDIAIRNNTIGTIKHYDRYAVLEFNDKTYQFSNPISKVEQVYREIDTMPEVIKCFEKSTNNLRRLFKQTRDIYPTVFTKSNF